jgi:hypothetical protein
MSRKSAAAFLFLSFAAFAQRPWQQVTVPSLRDAAANLKTPPHEYGAIQPFASWNGPDPAEVRQRIVRDLDRLAANGIFVVNLSPGRGEPKYLSPEHVSQIRFTVEEAGKRGMRLWIQDESDYPSGFAGGKISKLYPQLGMQGMVADIRVHVAPGQTLTMPSPPETLAIFATKTSPDQGLQGVVPIPVPANGQLKWIVPAQGSTPNEPRLSWEVVLVRHIYISSPTRNFNREDGTRAKDGLYSLIDYLDPEATRAFLKITHETYRQAAGDQFGKIVLGFFGDEPDYSISGLPWSPKLLEEFQERKGYDLKPYIPMFFQGKLSDEAQRAKADFYDVWSAIFRSSFFGEQAEWCKKYNVEYLVHLNHEETMPALERSEGDYFRDNRFVQVPGIDNLSQLVPDGVHRPDGTWNINNNFPKLASSAAHLFGHPQVWAEEGGGVGISGKFEMDFQVVRGVNALQIRAPILRGPGMDPSVATTQPPPVPPQAPMLAWYANRAGYLMAIGRPVAQVGVYHPGNSIWLNDQDADRSTTKLGWQLLEHQVDWDYFDEQSLDSVAAIGDGGFKNLSGQVYRAIVVPSSMVITRTGLERFRAFTKAGGKVIFVGKTPSFVVDKTLLNMKDKPDLSFATLIEESGDITPRVLAALPKPDVKLDAAFSRLTYTHKNWQDAEFYFFFNESNKAETRTATIAGPGKAQTWDLASGEIHPLSGATAEGDSVRVPLTLGPYEAKVIVIGPLPGGAADPEPSFASGATLAELNGDWTIELNGKQINTPLKSWEDLGTPNFAGPATYRTRFSTAAARSGQHLYLEMGEVHDYARVKVNGRELAAHAWQPYGWDITSASKTGANDLEIEVRATPAGRGFPGRGTPPPAVSGMLGPVRIVAR